METKILVLSDTHSSKLMEEFYNNFDFSKYDKIFHLGDYYKDGELLKYYLKDVNEKVVIVPGIYCEEYFKADIDNVKEVIINGKVFILSHTIEDGRKFWYKYPEFIHCYGHTHKYSFNLIGENKVTFNPGHLKNDIDRGQTASYGEIVINEDLSVEFKIIEYKTGKELFFTRL